MRFRDNYLPQDVGAHKGGVPKSSTYSSALLNSRLVTMSSGELAREQTVKILALDLPLAEKERRIAQLHAWLGGGA
jgi:hypothetical protein